jgi:hypothetical protein
MNLKLAIIGLIVVLISGLSLFEFVKKRSRSTLLQLCGCGLLLVMILTHVAEQFRVLPAMGWGRPGTAGHYVDLVSAAAGFALFCGGQIASLPGRVAHRSAHH